MSRGTHSELVISVWSPQWIDGSGAAQLSESLLRTDEAWQLVETWDLPAEMLGSSLQSVRNCGHATVRSDGSLLRPGFVPVAAELTRLQSAQRGPRWQCIVELASSTVACRPGLHSVDARYKVPEEAFDAKPGRRPSEIVQRVLSTFREICERFEPPWALCSTFGRGPSIAELYGKRDSATTFAAAYLSASVSPAILDEMERLAPQRRTAGGSEFILASMLGGPGISDEVKLDELLRSAMRQVSLPLVPWDILSELRDH